MFEFVGDPQLLEVHVFTGTDYTATPIETNGIYYFIYIQKGCLQ